MSIIHSRPNLFWVAATALTGMLLGWGAPASACSTMADGGACATTCGCCRTSDAPPPITPATVATSLLPTSGADHRLTGPDADDCPDVLPNGCSCRAQSPDFPEPATRPAEESRSDAGTAPAVVGLSLHLFSSTAPGSILSTAGPPSKAPLYLLNSRLLI